MPAHFRIERICGHARAGILQTRRGPLVTPAFMPVATRAAIKALPFFDIEEIGYPLVLANTYHLHLRPGDELVQARGGLHRWAGWPGAFLTDSGGFQVFSLARLRKITEEGVTFNSHLDGKKLLLSPETSLAIQWRLDSDILMAFDVCPALPSKPGELAEAVRLTTAWAARSKAELDRRGREGRLFFAINQGGLEVDLRKRSLEGLLPVLPDGLAIGGLSVGESLMERMAVLDSLIPDFPSAYPRYLMGVGTPLDFLEAVERGVDMFDCVQPTRMARHGACYTWSGRVNLKAKVNEDSDDPIDSKCGCKVCRRFSRSYIRHLFSVEEPVAATYASFHNLFFFYSLMGAIRESILAGTFEDYKKNLLAGHLGG